MRLCYPDFLAVSIFPNTFPNHQKLLAELRKIDHHALVVLDPDKKEISIQWIFPDETKKIGIIPVLTLKEGGKFPIDDFDDRGFTPLRSLIRSVDEEIENTSWGPLPALADISMEEALEVARNLRGQIYEIRCLHEVTRILNFG